MLGRCSELFYFYCFVFAFGSCFGSGYMAVVQGVIAVATIKFVSYLYRNVDNSYLFVLSLIQFVIIIKIISPVAYFTVWSITLFYVLFILLAIFKGKTSDDTKHMTVTEMYLALRDDIFKQKNNSLRLYGNYYCFSRIKITDRSTRHATRKSTEMN